MALTKYKIGKLIRVVDERNSYGIKDFYGINIQKEFMPTIANTDGLDGTKYKVVRKKRFVFSGMQTGRDKCIRIALYNNDNPVIVSPAYTTFEIDRLDLVLPEYFNMIFLSKEMDRFGWFCSDGSVRANLDWDVFENIVLTLPDITVQQKYVDIYNGMLANQQAYERGLEDLKLVCDSTIENLRKQMPCEKIGPYLEENKTININNDIKEVLGVCADGEFIKTKAIMTNVDISNYKIVSHNCIVYNPSRIKIGSIALYKQLTPCIVSPMYCVFNVINEDKLLPEYLIMWLHREEFFRYTWFYSAGSVRDSFELDLMRDVKIPIPKIEVQKAIANIYKAYIMRKEINDKLKAQIKDICPILIRGSLQE